MDDEILIVEDLENALPVEELIDYLEPSPEPILDDSIVTYEVTTGYDDLVLTELIILNESVNKLNGLIATLLFFTIATWVLQKVHRGVKEVIYIDRHN